MVEVREKQEKDHANNQRTIGEKMIKKFNLFYPHTLSIILGITR